MIDKFRLFQYRMAVISELCIDGFGCFIPHFYFAYLLLQTDFIVNLSFHYIINSQSFYSPSMKSYDWESQASSTQRLATLKRTYKQSYSLGPTQQEFINQVARIRLLQDELFAEKMKCQTMERKNIEYIETIAQLQYTISDLKFMLERANFQLKKYTDTDREMQLYVTSLKQVGQEITTLNEVLDKKNKECQKLVQANAKIKEQYTFLEQKYKNLESKKQAQRAKVRQILEILANDAEASFSEQIMRDMDLIEEGINDLKTNLSQTKSALQKSRKEYSQALIKQKQNIIALEYQLKLAEKRNQDLEKKKNMQASIVIDKRVEDIIEDMLKKQDELSLQIADLQNENDRLKEQIQSQKLSSSYYVQLKQNDYEKQLKNAKQTIKQLIHQKESLREKLEQMSRIQDIETSRSINEELQVSRKYRQSNEQNKRLKLKIIQLESDKKMLEKELSIRNASL